MCIDRKCAFKFSEAECHSIQGKELLNIISPFITQEAVNFGGVLITFVNYDLNTSLLIRPSSYDAMRQWAGLSE